MIFVRIFLILLVVFLSAAIGYSLAMQDMKEENDADRID